MFRLIHKVTKKMIVVYNVKETEEGLKALIYNRQTGWKWVDMGNYIPTWFYEEQRYNVPVTDDMDCVELGNTTTCADANENAEG